MNKYENQCFIYFVMLMSNLYAGYHSENEYMALKRKYTELLKKFNQTKKELEGWKKNSQRDSDVISALTANRGTVIYIDHTNWSGVITSDDNTNATCEFRIYRNPELAKSVKHFVVIRNYKRVITGDIIKKEGEEYFGKIDCLGIGTNQKFSELTKRGIFPKRGDMVLGSPDSDFMLKISKEIGVKSASK